MNGEQAGVQSTDNNGTCEVTVELSVTTQEVYESLGRLLEERQWIGSYSGVIGLDFFVTSQYTSLRRSAVIYPKAGLKAAAGRRVNTTFCTNGLLDEVKDNGVGGNAIAHYEYIGAKSGDTKSGDTQLILTQERIREIR
jgi:hypothetical protein